MRQRAGLLNAIRAHLAEFGVVAVQGPAKVLDLVVRLRAGGAFGRPEVAHSAPLALAPQLDGLARGSCALERQLMAWRRANAASFAAAAGHGHDPQGQMGG